MTANQRKTKMAKTVVTPVRVLEPVDLSAWLASEDGKKYNSVLQGATEIKDNGRLVGLVGQHVRVDILAAKTKVEAQEDGKAVEKSYDAEYVSLSARTIEGASMLMGDVVDETFEGEGDERREKPSVVKYFNQGFGILARNACAARIRTNVEGPDKQLLNAAKSLAKARGWEGDAGIEKALARIKALAED
jgi:hypothetical protein